MKRYFLLLLILGACGVEENPQISAGLTFIHLNDTYRIGAVESGTAGGFGRVVTTIKEAQAEGRDVRILHGGDFLYPSLESSLWNGMQMIDAFNFMDAIAPMYAVIGNHETDRRTPEHLANAIRASNFDWLADNYSIDTGDADVDAALQQAFTIDYDDRTIGFFALTLHADDGGNARDYLSIDRDYLAVAERAIAALDAKGADMIIGLTHLHLVDDIAIAALREQYPQFMLVVGGHDHEPEVVVLTDSTAGVYKGASNARVIWRIDVDFDENGVPGINPMMLTMDETVASDADYDVLEHKWRSQLLGLFPFLTARVGEAAVPLDGREETIRTGESNWGNFIVDQMLGAFGEPKADVAFINSGTLRIDDFISGDIPFEDIGRTFGFSSFLRHVNLTGREFRKVLEAGFRGGRSAQGYFPQIAGFRVCVDRSRTVGDRIVSLQLMREDSRIEMEDDETYMAVVSDFIFRGNDGYTFPESAVASRPGSELRYLVLDAIIQAQAQGLKVGAPVDPGNPRIRILSNNDKSCWQ